MKLKKKPFKIEHIDPLGQGVSKIGDQVTFISKTLPGEEGIALILKEKKGVQFGVLNNLKDLTIEAKERISSKCPHFDSCPSCHFLHTNYEHEIIFKTKSLVKIFSKLIQEHDLLNLLTYHPAPERFNYRNRIQLHYDLNQKKLGYHDGSLGEIVPVPGCKLGTNLVTQKLSSLYENDSWIGLVGRSSLKKGHIEIYERSGKEVEVTVNQQYSKGGFTQVNKVMDSHLKELIKKTFSLFFTELKKTPIILDLFGGNGNLSENLNPSSTYIVDNYITERKTKSPHQNFIKENLFGKKALSNLEKTLKNKGATTIDLMIVDPPRSGFKSIKEFCESFTPPFLFYISCNPSTLQRDLYHIKDSYQIEEVHILDFFPSTFHFETLVIARKKV